MRITSKGQVTIPQEIREKAGLLPNTEVDFDYTGGKVTIKPSKKSHSKGQRLVQALRGSAGPVKRGMSTDELMKLLRGDD
ncbi:MAG: AbrB/MazE/SpoVT family DNA-binding domain-containing protein [Burkholderiales bacterium]